MSRFGPKISSLFFYFPADSASISTFFALFSTCGSHRSTKREKMEILLDLVEILCRAAARNVRDFRAHFELPRATSDKAATRPLHHKMPEKNGD